MKVTAILKGKPDSNGKQTIYIRTNVGKKRTFKATKMKASANEWDAVKGRCKSNHPKASDYNTIIRKLIVETEAAGLKATNVTHEDTFLFKYCYACIDGWENTKKESTLKQYRWEMNKLKGYTVDRKMSSIGVSFLEGYQRHCFDLGNSSNTVWKSFKFLRMIFIKAHKERIIPENPFSQFKIVQYRNPKRFFLTSDEIKAVEEYSMDERKPASHRFAAKWFVIGCYTGLRYGDMAVFNKDEHIRNGRLILYTSKTGELVSIKFKDRLKQLFERVGYKPLYLENQPYNRYLKDIQRDCKIKTTITAHMSRHTFGVYCADQGLGIETTAKLMGHTDIKTTAIYYKISNRRLDAEVDRLF